jgi:hypothetical protein
MDGCGIAQRFPIKHHLEEDVILNFNYTDALMVDPGLRIEKIRPIQVVVLAGEDPDPSTVLGGIPALSDDGATVQFPMTGGLAGTTYMFFVTVELSNGMTALVQGYVSVI